MIYKAEVKRVEEVYILLDVGGTEIKCGISDQRGNLKNNICSYPSYAKENKKMMNLLLMIIFLQEVLKESVKRSWDIPSLATN